MTIITTDNDCRMWTDTCATPTRITKGKEYIKNLLVQLKEDKKAQSDFLFIFENSMYGHSLNSLVAIYHKQTNRQLFGKQWELKAMDFWNNCKLAIKYSVYTGTINNNNNITTLYIRNATKDELI